MYISPGRPRPRITVLGAGIDSGPTTEAPRFILRNSIFAAEIVASRRMLSHLDSHTTRVGVITFSDDAQVRQSLTHDFAQVRKILDEVCRSGPYGGTYIPLLRPADLLVAMESISAVDVHFVQVINQTTGQKATRTRLGADGFFATAIPLAEGPD